MAGAFGALTCWVSLSPELAEFVTHLWCRLEGCGSDRWEVGLTGVFYWLGVQQRSFKREKRGGGGIPLPHCAINYLLTSLLICASPAGGANSDKASQQTLRALWFSLIPGH